jgi:signal transduction histidine kinase
LADEKEAARASELAAREASQRMEEFLATAAHDLRSPLTATVGYIQLAEHQTEQLVAAARKACPDLAQRVEAAHVRVDDAGRSTEQLTQLLTRLSDTTAVRAGKLEVNCAPYDLVALIDEHVKALRMAAPDRTIRLHTPLGGEPVTVNADADRIRQVVANYVTNALKYSPKDQPVDVKVTARGGQARIAVRDKGSGIPPEEQSRVWELFHRGPGMAPQNEATIGSLGLGLHICQAIVEGHGGTVGVQSEVGHGSTFWFELPLSSAGQKSAGQ